MGDIADGILDGDFDEETGEYIGPAMGFPRSLAREARERNSKYKNKPKAPTTGMNAVKGVQNFLKGKVDEEDFDVIILRFAKENLNYDEIDNIGICNEIQKDFSRFVVWFKKTYKNK